MKTWLVFASGFLCCESPAFALSNLTVMSDGSASVAVTKLAREYARNSGMAVATSFLDKDAQAVQIAEGAAADVLITSDVRWIDELKMQGLIDVHSKTGFARGRMALVGPADSDLVMKLNHGFICAPLVHAMHSEPELFLGNPEYVPEGRYAREALRNLDALDVLESYTLYLKSQDEMVEQVAQNHAYSVMSYGRALLVEHAKIIDVFPDNSHSAMHYYAVVIAGDNMEEARKFTKFLASNKAAEIINASAMYSVAR